MSRIEALALLKARFNAARELETSPDDVTHTYHNPDPQYGWIMYEKSILGHYTMDLSIPDEPNLYDIFLEGGENLRVLDLAGPGIFIDNSIPVKCIIAVTATNMDEKLSQSLKKAGRDFNPNRRLICGNLFEDSTWGEIVKQNEEYDVICFRPGLGLHPEVFLNGWDNLKDDYAMLDKTRQSVVSEYIRLFIRSYNLLANEGRFYGKIPNEGLNYEGKEQLYKYIDILFGSLNIGCTRQEDRIILYKNLDAPATIDESVLDINILGCQCEPGCDLRMVRTREGLMRALSKRAPVKGMERGFKSHRSSRNKDRVTSVGLDQRGGVKAVCRKRGIVAGKY